MTTYSINDASKASGLTPSVIRVWEGRYGWPKPHRQANGYRVYEAHQIEDLRRVSELVKCGMSIRQIIVDGFPRWPTRQIPRRAKWGPWNLPKPTDVLASRLQGDIVQALERGQISVVKELLHRAIWMMHPHDEVIASLMPVLFGLGALADDGCSPADQEDLRRLVTERCLQRLRSFPAHPGTWVMPTSTADQPLAALVALAFCLNGSPAQPWLSTGAPTGGMIILVGHRADENPEPAFHFKDIRDFSAYEFTAH